jgi:Ca2+-binding EF-hand superfamily protein
VDENRDLELTRREFTRVSSEVFNRWDREGDGVLKANELTAGLHGNLDMDRDRRLRQREFNDGWSRSGLETADMVFNTLDRDRDGFLTEAELGGGLNDSGYRDRWNFGDRGLARADFNAGL